MELRFEQLVKDFQGTRAVDVGNLTIQDGKLTGLLGPSGCGKSTLLYLISGLEKPTSGKIFFGGRDVTDLPAEKRGIGLVFQNYALYPHMTVAQNIAFPLVNSRMDKAKIRARTAELAKLVQIEDMLDRKPNQLSGGQQQRVAIARALAKKPEVLLLDEPLSNLDARLRLEMREEIRRIQVETGVTTIFVTHDQEEAMSITDEVILMKKGVVQQQCEPQQMYLEPVNQFVASFLGNPPIDFFTLPVREGKMQLAPGCEIPVRTDISGDICVGIRPECWGLGDQVQVTVLAVENRGKEVQITFDLDGKQGRTLLGLDASVKPGDRIGLQLQKRFVYFFDENGNRMPAEVVL